MGSEKTKVCGYRYCGRTFVDASPKSSMSYCHPEHRRREKQFRSGKAQDISFFRNPDPVLDSREEAPETKRCFVCGEPFQVFDKGARCPTCREKARHKKCSGCGTAFVDGSLKNTRRFCDACTRKRLDASVGVSSRKERRQNQRVRKGEGGRADDITTMRKGSTSWWGRVGEMLYQHLFPMASDAVLEYGNGSPFDLQHPDHGRVNVKTAQERKPIRGKVSWVFQVSGVQETCDCAFCIGFDRKQEHVVIAWLIPSADITASLRVLTPGSKEYTGDLFSMDEASIRLMDRKFQVLLQDLVPVPVPQPKVEYDRMVLGRLGECIYQKIHPEADHVAARDPVETFDFLDADGSRVNVRLRRWAYRKSGEKRWTFFRSDTSTADVYYFIGVDRSAQHVHACYRVPLSDLPRKGFSVPVGGVTKWDHYRVPLVLPQPLSAFVGVDDITQRHLEIQGLNAQSLARMSSAEIELLLRRARGYYRILGFPYPKIPPDEYLARDMKRYASYAPEGKTLPAETVGLGLCSAYMPHRFRAKNADADFSALGAFEDDERLLRALRFCLQGKTPGLGGTQLRNALTALNRTPVNFRPAVAKALVDTFCSDGGVVFDPCAGWGGRMVGTLVSGRKYVGVEPLDETYARLYQLGMRVCEFLGLKRDTVSLHHGRIQDVEVLHGAASFSLTSPPFWEKEIYGDVGNAPSNFDSWCEDFLSPMFDKVFLALCSGSRFAVHVSDIRHQGRDIPLERTTIEIGEEKGFHLEDVWYMMKSSFGKQEQGRRDPILIFRM